MGKTKMTAEFLHDSRQLFDSAQKAVQEMERSLRSGKVDIAHITEHLNQLFRDIHSIKSEASFLHLETFTRQANDLETLLDAIRRGKEKLKLSILGEIGNTIAGLKLQVKDLETSGEFETEPHKTELRSAETEYLPFFNDFELNLIEEARERGEALYRLVCEIDNSETMKYPRIFLIINNLELLVNVIKVDPAIEKIEKENVGEIVVYFSTSVPERDIYNAVNVDQVKRVSMVSLRYDSVFTGERGIEKGRDREQPPSPGLYTRVETDKLDELSGYVDEIQFSAYRMHRSFDSFMQVNTKKEFETLLQTIGAMEALLKSVRLLPLSLAYERLEHLVRDMTIKTGKKVSLETSGGGLEADRRLLDLLSEPLVHLVRNSIDHGIEAPEERRTVGKNEVGTISVSAKLDGNKLVLTIADDGRGIDIEAVEAALKEEGREERLDDADDLLFLIAQPGFSTLPEATDYSGRGVGLDLVVRKIHEIEGGEIHLKSIPGRGAAFTLIIPKGYTLLNILLTRTGSTTIAIPKRSVVESYSLQKDLYSRERDGLLLYNGLPVYTVQGRVLMKDRLPLENFGVTLDHLGRKGCLILDELLFEKQIAEDQLVLGEEISPHLYAVYVNKRKMEFFYLNTAIIA